MEECGLIDLGYLGYRYTWCNGALTKKKKKMKKDFCFEQMWTLNKKCPRIINRELEKPKQQ